MVNRDELTVSSFVTDFLFVDEVETLAIERAKKLFNCGFANVQPHSGSQANQTVMLALVKPGEKILGMSLAAGAQEECCAKTVFKVLDLLAQRRLRQVEPPSRADEMQLLRDRDEIFQVPQLHRISRYMESISN